MRIKWTFFGVVKSCLYCFLIPIRLFVTPWTAACQAPLSLGFPRQEYWSELPFSSPRDLPNPGIEPRSPSLAGRFFTTDQPGKPLNSHLSIYLFYLLEMSSTWIYGNISGKIKMWLSSNGKLKFFYLFFLSYGQLNSVKM